MAYLQTSDLHHTILKLLKLFFKQPDFCYFAPLPLYDTSFQNDYPHTKEIVFCSWHTAINSCRVTFAHNFTKYHIDALPSTGYSGRKTKHGAQIY